MSLIVRNFTKVKRQVPECKSFDIRQNKVIYLDSQNGLIQKY